MYIPVVLNTDTKFIPPKSVRSWSFRQHKVRTTFIRSIPNLIHQGPFLYVGVNWSRKRPPSWAQPSFHRENYISLPRLKFTEYMFNRFIKYDVLARTHGLSKEERLFQIIIGKVNSLRAMNRDMCLLVRLDGYPRYVNTLLDSSEDSMRISTFRFWGTRK